MIENDMPWMIVQDKVDIFHKPPGSIYCDRRQHLLIINYAAFRKVSVTSSTSTTGNTDGTSTINGNSTNSIDSQTVIYLERIHYIQRGDGKTTGRSAIEYNKNRSSRQYKPNEQFDPQKRQLVIYYSTDHPRSEYLYKKTKNFQLMTREEEFDKWVNALYAVIDEAKNVNDAEKRTRWLLREYEKLKRSSGGLTFDSINSWLNSHIGLVGEKHNIEMFIKKHEIFRQSNEITDSVFKATYYHFIDKQQETLITMLMSDIIEEKQILSEKFASRVVNTEFSLLSNELEQINKFLRLNDKQTEVSLKNCADYLWSDANSAFNPKSRRECNQDMNQPLNHYWISSSHNTYLAKTQIFNPASVHCYIQALLNGCRCIEIDTMDGRNGLEPEITHKNTRIRPIPLREVVHAIHDYAFVTSEYPVIISIENHCSPSQRNIMAHMFIEILGEYLVQAPLSPNEISLPSPDQLKRRIILKDAKMNNIPFMVSQASIDSEDSQDHPSLDLEGPIQLYDFAKKIWRHYKYSFANFDLYLAEDNDIQKQQNSDDDDDEYFSDDDFSDEENEENSQTNDELTQIWYHRNITHEDARRLLLLNAGYEPGTFLVRRSLQKNCYCITFLASNSVVKSIIINTLNEDGKCFYALSNKKFETIPDLVAYYRTYDFAEVTKGTNTTVLHRLSKPLPRVTWHQELTRQPWYQPNLTRSQTEELLFGIGEEMTFLIRESTNRARQDYTISIYTKTLSSETKQANLVHHSPIYRDGSDLMLMSLTFTSLIELVDYFSRKPVFKGLYLQKAAKPYAEFVEERRHYVKQGIHKDIMTFKQLSNEISLKVDTLRTLDIKENTNDQTVDVQLYVYEEDKKTNEGYLLKFNTMKDWKIFLSKICPGSTPTLTRGQDEKFSSTTSIATTSGKSTGSSIFYDQSQATELNKLIVYCQGVKLKEYSINKAQDLGKLTFPKGKIESFKEMISLNNVKGSLFCSELKSMILFNQRHFTRIYPEFSKKSWDSTNFDPISYWFVGCQMVALNFQTPDRPMHMNAGRFLVNGGCGYVLMPNYIRSYNADMSKSDIESMLLKIRVLAVRHLRADYTKSISKVQVKITIIGKQRAAENQTCSTTINGPCGIWDLKHASKSDQLHSFNRLNSENSDIDLLYFEIFADNEGFCGQSAIPLSSLRTGIRSIQLYDKFNARLDMSAILVDLNFRAV